LSVDFFLEGEEVDERFALLDDSPALLILSTIISCFYLEMMLISAKEMRGLPRRVVMRSRRRLLIGDPHGEQSLGPNLKARVTVSVGLVSLIL
jgi:predicted Ser/Thr protein kinase